MKSFLSIFVVSMTLLFSVFPAWSETIQEEAARRLPPVLYALNLPTKLLSGQPYTVTWSLLGYHSGYRSKVILFNCSGVAADTCGADVATGFSNSVNLDPVSSETGKWDYHGVLSTVSHYSTTFTAPTVSGDTDMVLRFFQVNETDAVTGQGSLSLLAPGGLANVGYYDASGRRLVVKVYDPAGFVGDGSPRVSAIAAQTTDVNTATTPISFSIADLESDASTLRIAVNSSNPALVDSAHVYLTGSGHERSLVVLPTTGQAGTANITVSVSDGIHSTVKTFTLTVGSALSITNTSVTEDDSGTVNAEFTVSLDRASSQTIIVDFTTSASGGATADVDFTTTTGTLTIPAGQTSGTLSVPVLGDLLSEANEVFRVTLTNPVNATILDATGDATIINDDPDPTVTFTSAIQSANEGSLVTATVQLSVVSSFDASVPFTVSGTATPILDYSSLSLTPLIIPAGSASGEITFYADTDAANDDGETVILTLDAPSYATLGTTTVHTVTLNNTVLHSIVPKTGQTTPYAAGDDGTLKSGIAWPDPRFTTNNNGTVTDNLTGLIWLTNANCFGAKNWDNALASANTLASGSCGLSDGSVAGDWRLPNRKELRSLIDYGHSNPALPSGHPFSGVQASYWSGTSYAGNTSDAWDVNPSYGIVYNRDRTSTYFVWPVKGEAVNVLAPVPKSGQTTSYGTGDDGTLQKGTPLPNPRFNDMGDGTVTDLLTNLIWLKNANCWGSMNWSAALAKVADLNGGTVCSGYTGHDTDWRLPSINELESLVDAKRANPSLPSGHAFSGVQTSTYWSGTSYADFTSYAWGVYLYGGFVSSYDKAVTFFVWPVRGGQ